MERFVLEHEPILRLAAFLGVFAAVALAEIAAPKRRLRDVKWRRWATNIAMTALNTGAVRLIFATAAVGAAAAMEVAGLGLFNEIDLPLWIEIVGALLLLDLAVYLQHVLLHAAPGLWRFHMMHHADLDIDVTTGVRFHVGEILFSMAYKTMVVAALGAPLVAVVLFEIVLNTTSMFNHGNVALPARVDRVLRLFVVTPDMHRVHHSVVERETNSNFGFNLPWWDRLFGTYRAQPAAGHESMVIGLEQFRNPSRLGFLRLLALPFVGARGGYPLGARSDAG